MASIVLAGIRVTDPLSAVFTIIVFGAAYASLPTFLRYIGAPANAFNLALFNVLLGYVLVFSMYVLECGLYITGLPVALILISAMSALNARQSDHARIFDSVREYLNYSRWRDHVKRKPTGAAFR